MKVNLYRYSGASNIINKELPTPDTKTGFLNDMFDLDNPSFKFTTFSIDYNYCYIDDLKRYYWIDHVTIDPNGLYIVDMSIDVLMTFKDKILSGTAHITSNAPDKFNSDQQATPQQEFQTITLTNPFDYDKGSVILIGLNTGGN